MLKWRPRTQFWIILIMCAIVFFYFDIMNMQTYFLKQNTYFPSINEFFSEADQLKGYSIRTPGCSIPEMNPMDASIRKFIYLEKEIICNKGIPALVDSNLTSIYLLRSSLLSYKIKDIKLLKCCFQEFHRVDPTKNSKDQVVKFDELCHEFNDSINIPHEFIRVQCTYNQTQIYKDFFNFVPLKNTNNTNLNTNKLNVLLIGIDSISRLNLYRQMPKTVAYLKEINAIEMFGYNKVADNTFPNLLPILTGRSIADLNKDCWPGIKYYFDDCSYLWGDYKKAGFTTAFVENYSWMGLFYYNKKGFKHQPTDYWYGHFDFTAEKQIGGAAKTILSHHCFGARSVHKVLLDYTNKFTLTMHNNKQPYFGLFWASSMSHDYLNKPKLGDVDYFEMLQGMKNRGILNNTVLIFLSDHGIRFGPIRNTYQGWMEERLPFIYFILPDWYMKEHDMLVDNLRTNTKRLTTPFDLHETLRDLIDPFKLTNQFLAERYSNQVVQRGYSLFDKIPINRSCDTAGITPHWCTCQSSKELSTEKPIIIEVAKFIVYRHINPLLQDFTDCVSLELSEIIAARLQTTTNELKKATSTEDYAVTLKTKPGGAIFEATVRKNISLNGDYHFNLTGTVSRINLYGEQSVCINDSFLKLYCFCKQFL